MAKTYYTVLTTYGAQLFAQAMANRQQVRITQFAVGDGNGRAVQPDSARTSLVRQVHRANISAVSPDPRNNKQVIFELTIPENVGGFWIREMGIYDNNNRLVAYANCPDTYKPQLSEGSGKIQVVRMILLVSSSNAVTLSVDDSVIFVTRGQLTPKTITATSQNGVDETGHTHAIAHGNTTQKGIVQTTSDTGLDSEELAFNAKGAKKLAQQIAQNQQAIAGLNSGKVDKTAISNSVSSKSQTNVASSQAVKTAYDKGVEAKNAADAAQQTANDGVNKANNANTNANGRVSKAGDTMTGNLVVPYLRAMGGYISTTAKNADFAGLDIIREGSLGAWLSRIEAMPDKRWKFWTQNGYEVFIPAQNGTVALEHNVVRKAGDVMAGDLEVPYLKVQRDNAWVNIVSRANSRASLDYSVNTDRVAQASVVAMDVGGYGVELQFLTTPQGDNYDTDRRHHVMTIGHSGNIWAKAYGWLHDAFAKQAKHGWYPNHYQGAQTFKIPIGQGPHCMLITTMRVDVSNYPQDFWMPEAYAGWTIPVASDVGQARHSVGVAIIEGNKVRVWGRTPMGVHIQVIGFAEY